MSEFNKVDLDNPTKDIAVFSETNAALASLKERYEVVPDVSTKSGYEQVKEAVSVLTKCRTTVEKERKRWKAPFLSAGKMIDEEAKRITSAVLSIEGPVRAAKDEYDNAERIAKEKRIAGIELRIDDISNCVNMARGKSSEMIQEIIQEVGEIDTLEGFYELTEKAIQTRINTLADLKIMLSDVVSREEFAKEKAEFEVEFRAKQKEMLEMEAAKAVEPDYEDYNQPMPMPQPRREQPQPVQEIPATLTGLNAWAEKFGVSDEAMQELRVILNS